MSRLAPYAPLVLEAVREIHRRHAIAGWYDVRSLIQWLERKHRPELKALYGAYRDAPEPKRAVQAAIEAYLPALNQKKEGTIPVEPKGSVIMWKVTPRTAPPAEAPAPATEVAPPERPRRARGQTWVARIDQGDLAGLRR